MSQTTCLDVEIVAAWLQGVDDAKEGLPLDHETCQTHLTAYRTFEELRAYHNGYAERLGRSLQ